MDVKEIILAPEVDHSKREANFESKIERGPARDMIVYFPDGTIIAEKKAVDTLVAVVKKMVYQEYVRLWKIII